MEQFLGGSEAPSSTLQSFDAVLGVEPKDTESKFVEKNKTKQKHLACEGACQVEATRWILIKSPRRGCDEINYTVEYSESRGICSRSMLLPRWGCVGGCGWG